MRRRAVIVIAVAALAIAIAAAVRWRAGEEPMGPTATVERGAIERIVVASGTIEPEDLVEVRPKVSGIIQRFHVEAERAQFLMPRVTFSPGLALLAFVVLVSTGILAGLLPALRAARLDPAVALREE